MLCNIAVETQPSSAIPLHLTRLHNGTQETTPIRRMQFSHAGSGNIKLEYGRNAQSEGWWKPRGRLVGEGEMKMAASGRCFVTEKPSLMSTNSWQETERHRKRAREWQCMTDVAMAPALLPRTQNGLTDKTFSCTKKNPKKRKHIFNGREEPNPWPSMVFLLLAWTL